MPNKQKGCPAPVVLIGLSFSWPLRGDGAVARRLAREIDLDLPLQHELKKSETKVRVPTMRDMEDELRFESASFTPCSQARINFAPSVHV